MLRLRPMRPVVGRVEAFLPSPAKQPPAGPDWLHKPDQPTRSFSETLNSISDAQREVAGADRKLRQTISASREIIAQSKELIARVDAVLNQR